MVFTDVRYYEVLQTERCFYMNKSSSLTANEFSSNAWINHKKKSKNVNIKIFLTFLPCVSQIFKHSFQSLSLSVSALITCNSSSLSTRSTDVGDVFVADLVNSLLIIFWFLAFGVFGLLSLDFVASEIKNISILSTSFRPYSRRNILKKNNVIKIVKG